MIRSAAALATMRPVLLVRLLNKRLFEESVVYCPASSTLNRLADGDASRHLPSVCRRSLCKMMHDCRPSLLPIRRPRLHELMMM